MALSQWEKCGGYYVIVLLVPAVRMEHNQNCWSDVYNNTQIVVTTKCGSFFVNKDQGYDVLIDSKIDQ